MALYMTQKMSYGTLPAKMYYRKQSQEHVSHTESGRFTQDARNNYAVFNHIDVNLVEVGEYQSNQGIPTGKGTFEI
jgi:hypothetical protein